MEARAHPFSLASKKTKSAFRVQTSFRRLWRIKERGIAVPRSKKSRKSASPKIFSGTANGQAPEHRVFTLYQICFAFIYAKQGLF